ARLRDAEVVQEPPRPAPAPATTTAVAATATPAPERAPEPVPEPIPEPVPEPARAAPVHGAPMQRSPRRPLAAIGTVAMLAVTLLGWRAVATARSSTHLAAAGRAAHLAPGDSIVARRFYEEGLRAFYQFDANAANRLFRAALREDSTSAMA